MEALLSLPRCRTINEGERFLEVYREATGDTPVRGNLVPDAHLAAVLRENDTVNSLAASFFLSRGKPGKPQAKKTARNESVRIHGKMTCKQS